MKQDSYCYILPDRLRYITHELNYGYHFCVPYKIKANPWSKLKSGNKLATKLRNLVFLYKNNLLYAQKLWK